MITMEQKYQPRICQQEFLHEGSSQSACQFFRALKRNLAQTAAPCPWNFLHSYSTGIISQGTSVPDHSASLSSTRERNSLQVGEAGLQGQDAEFNNSPRKQSLCEKGARWEVVAQAQPPLGAALPAMGQSQGQEQSPSMPPQHCSQEQTEQQVLRSLHTTAQPHQCCKGAETHIVHNSAHIHHAE